MPIAYESTAGKVGFCMCFMELQEAASSCQGFWLLFSKLCPVLKCTGWMQGDVILPRRSNIELQEC
jgi:hypothetical protein